MKISFLVTYYNQEAFVRQSLDSILAIRKPGEWEILIGDDGSTDGTRDVAEEYVARDPAHIRLCVMPREAGRQYDPVRRASANRLNLLGQCGGDCFCTLDGDDFFTDTEFVAEAMDIFQAHPEVSLAAFGYREYRDGTFGDARVLPFAKGSVVPKRKFIRDWYLPAGACVHRIRWGADRVEYIRRIGYFDDNNILLNTLNGGGIYSVGRPIYAYRQTGESVFTSMNMVEKCMLVVQGMDVDLKLMDDQWRRDVLSRYANPLETVWIARHKLRDILGAQKHARYLEGCRRIGDSIGEALLTWDDLAPDKKRALARTMRTVARDNPLRVLNARLNSARRGDLK